MVLRRTGGRPLGAREPPNTFSTSPTRLSGKLSPRKFANQDDELTLTRVNSQVKKYISNIENTSPTPKKSSSDVTASPRTPKPSSRTATQAKTITPTSTGTRTPSQVSLLSKKFESSTLDETTSSPSRETKVVPSSPSRETKVAPSSPSRTEKASPSSPSRTVIPKVAPPSPTRSKAPSVSWFNEPSSTARPRTPTPSSFINPESPVSRGRLESPTRGRRSPGPRPNPSTETSSSAGHTSPLRPRSSSPAHATEFIPLRTLETAQAQARSEAIASSKVKAKSPPTSPSLKQSYWERPRSNSSLSSHRSVKMEKSPVVERISRFESSLPEASPKFENASSKFDKPAQITEKLAESSGLPKVENSPRIEETYQFDKSFSMFHSKAPSDPLNSSTSSSASNYSTCSTGQLSRHGTMSSISSASSTYSAIATQPSPKLGKTPCLPPPSRYPYPSSSAFEINQPEQQREIESEPNLDPPRESEHEEAQEDIPIFETTPQSVLEKPSVNEVEDENHEEVTEEYIVNRRRPGSPKHCPAPVYKIVDLNRQPSSAKIVPPSFTRFDLHMDDSSSLPPGPRFHIAMSLNQPHPSMIPGWFPDQNQHSETISPKVSTPLIRLLQEGFFAKLLLFYIIMIYLLA